MHVTGREGNTSSNFPDKSKPADYKIGQFPIYTPVQPMPHGEDFFEGANSPERIEEGDTPDWVDSHDNELLTDKEQGMQDAFHQTVSFEQDALFASSENSAELAKRITHPADRLLYIMGYGAVESDDNSRKELYMDMSRNVVDYYVKVQAEQLPGTRGLRVRDVDYDYLVDRFRGYGELLNVFARLGSTDRRAPNSLKELIGQEIDIPVEINPNPDPDAPEPSEEERIQELSGYIQLLKEHYGIEGDDWEEVATNLMAEHYVYFSTIESVRLGLRNAAHPLDHIGWGLDQISERRSLTGRSNMVSFETWEDYRTAMIAFMSDFNTFKNIVDVLRNPDKNQYVRGSFPTVEENRHGKVLKPSQPFQLPRDKVGNQLTVNAAVSNLSLSADVIERCDKMSIVMVKGSRRGVANSFLLHTIYPYSEPAEKRY